MSPHPSFYPFPTLRPYLCINPILLSIKRVPLTPSKAIFTTIKYEPMSSRQSFVVQERAIFTTIKYKPMSSRQSFVVQEREKINTPGRQDTLLTASLPMQKGRYKCRKGWSRPGVFGKAKISSFATVVVPPLFIRCPKVTVNYNLGRDVGMMTLNLYGDMFCHPFE